jgi:hypothetical protein
MPEASFKDGIKAAAEIITDEMVRRTSALVGGVDLLKRLEEQIDEPLLGGRIEELRSGSNEGPHDGGPSTS